MERLQPLHLKALAPDSAEQLRLTYQLSDETSAKSIPVALLPRKCQSTSFGCARGRNARCGHCNVKRLLGHESKDDDVRNASK